MLLSGKYDYVAVIYTPAGFVFYSAGKLQTIKQQIRTLRSTYKSKAFLVCLMRDIRGKITLERYQTLFKKFLTASNAYALNREAVWKVYADWREMFQGGFIVSELFNLQDGENVHNPVILPGNHRSYDTRRIYLDFADARVGRSIGSGYSRFLPRLLFPLGEPK